MNDPYAVLGVAADADDATIRGRYLQLVKQFTPEGHPERFAAIRQAYDSLKDVETRLRGRLFEAGKHETAASIVEELACRSSRRRMSLANLLALVPPT
ncbi:MAG: J domain-containing protein [Gemmataceae bacterium]|nr:J domain-containing protein [Gemmataceae bacterium]